MFRTVFFMIQGALILLSAHYVLSKDEPEGFFEIFGVPGFVPQYLIQVAAISLLTVILNILTNRYVYRMYGTKSRHLFRDMVLTTAGAILLSMGFVYGYLFSLGRDFDITTYLNQLWAFLVFLFALVALILLGYLWERFFIMGRPLDAGTEDDGEIVAIPFKGQNVALSKDYIGLLVRDERHVAVYKFDGSSFRSRSSILQMKKLLADDDRFFATGSWIVHRAAIKGVEEGPSVRSKVLILCFSYTGKVIVPKERVSEFNIWMARGITDRPLL